MVIFFSSGNVQWSFLLDLAKILTNIVQCVIQRDSRGKYHRDMALASLMRRHENNTAGKPYSGGDKLILVWIFFSFLWYWIRNYLLICVRWIILLCDMKKSVSQVLKMVVGGGEHTCVFNFLLDHHQCPFYESLKSHLLHIYEFCATALYLGLVRVCNYFDINKYLEHFVTHRYFSYIILFEL